MLLFFALFWITSVVLFFFFPQYVAIGLFAASILIFVWVKFTNRQLSNGIMAVHPDFVKPQKELIQKYAFYFGAFHAQRTFSVTFGIFWFSMIILAIGLIIIGKPILLPFPALSFLSIQFSMGHFDPRPRYEEAFKQAKTMDEKLRIITIVEISDETFYILNPDQVRPEISSADHLRELLSIS